jgi:hypothetical protein
MADQEQRDRTRGPLAVRANTAVALRVLSIIGSGARRGKRLLEILGLHAWRVLRKGTGLVRGSITVQTILLFLNVWYFTAGKRRIK